MMNEKGEKETKEKVEKAIGKMLTTVFNGSIPQNIMNNLVDEIYLIYKENYLS